MKKLLSSILLAASLVLPACTTVVEKTVVVEQGEVARFDTLRQATVMVEMNDGKELKGSCSAVAISPKILLTAAHCDVGDNFKIVGVGSAVKVRKDVSKDLMLLFVEKANLPFVPVSQFDPLIDTAVVTVGYPLGMGQVATEGRVQGEMLLDGIPAEVLERLSGYEIVSSPIIFGNSGGPVFAKINGEWRVVGIVSAVAAMGFGMPVPHIGLAVKPSVIKEFLGAA